MAFAIETPYPIFTGEDDNLLDAGYLWFGVANQDPQSSPIVVYWDSALTIPAQQPVRTLAGIPVRAGAPASLFIASDYSLRVQDSKGITRYTVPNSSNLAATLAGSGGSALIGFIHSGVGAVARTVEAKLRDFRSVQDYGAVGDGVADDTAAIQAAITAAATGGFSVFVPGTANYYKISAQLVGAAAVMIWGVGIKSRIKQTTANQNGLLLADDMVVKNILLEGDGLLQNRAGPGQNLLNNGIYGNGVKRCLVEHCFGQRWQWYGILLNNCFDCDVVGFEGRFQYWDYPAFAPINAGDSKADIGVQSTTAGGRIRIINPRCHSNTALGIYIDALGFDAQTICTGAICEPLKDDGTPFTNGTGLNQVHNISLGYNATAEVNDAHIITDFLCRASNASGVYVIANSTGPTNKAIRVSNGFCDLNGLDQANIANSGQRSGVRVSGAVAAVDVTGVTVTNFNGLASEGNAAFQIALVRDGTQTEMGCKLTGCRVYDSTSPALGMTQEASNIEVEDLQYQRCFGGLRIGTTATDVGNINIRNFRQVEASSLDTCADIEIFAPNATGMITIDGFDFGGPNKTTATAANSGVYVIGTLPPLTLRNGRISNRFRAIYPEASINGRNSTLVLEHNYIEEATTGYAIAGDGTGVVPILGASFGAGVTNKLNASVASGYFVSNKNADGTYILEPLAAVPAAGTWVNGDMVPHSDAAATEPSFYLRRGGAWVNGPAMP